MATNGIVAKWESNHGEDDPLVRGDRLIYQQDDHEQCSLTSPAKNREGHLEHSSETGDNTQDISAVNSTCASHAIENHPTMRGKEARLLLNRSRATYSHTLGVSIQ